MSKVRPIINTDDFSSEVRNNQYLQVFDVGGEGGSAGATVGMAGASSGKVWGILPGIERVREVGLGAASGMRALQSQEARQSVSQ